VDYKERENTELREPEPVDCNESIWWETSADKNVNVKMKAESMIDSSNV